MNVLHTGEQVGELGEFVIVRGKKRARAGLPLKMLDDGPGDGEAVESGGAATDFVKQDKTRRRRMVQDRSDFAHFDEKRRTAASEIVARPNAREDAVGNRELRLTRRNEGAHLGHENDQRRLAKVSGFAAHIWTSDQQQLLAAGIEAEVVGNEALALLAEKLFDDRMAA